MGLTEDFFEFIDSNAAVAPAGLARLRLKGGVLQQSTNGGEYGALGQGGLIGAGSSGATFANAVAAAIAGGGGYTIELGKGTYNMTSLLDLTANGISIIGNGIGSTFIQIDSSLDGSDFLTIDSILGCTISGVTFTTNIPRTGGATVKVKGTNTINATPAQRTRQWTMLDVHFEDQFNCLVINDDGSSHGAWGGYMDRCEMIRTTANGTAIWMDSPSGGQQYIANVKIYGNKTGASGTRALAGVRYTSGNDFELWNVNAIFLQKGLLVDATSGKNANVLYARECLWDSCSVLDADINPAAGGTANLLSFIGNWFGIDSSIATVDNIHIGGAAKSISILGGHVIGPAVGILADGTGGATDIHVGDRTFFTGQTTGFKAQNSLTNFSVGAVMRPQAVLGTSAPAVGINVADVGCNFYELRSNIHTCATPISDSGGANKVISNL